MTLFLVKRMIALVLITFSPFLIYSQDINSLNEIQEADNENNEKLSPISSPFVPSSKDIYLNDGWQHGLLLTNEDEIVHFNGRLNILRKHVEVKVDKKIRKLYPKRLKVLIIDGDRYVHIPGDKIVNDRGDDYFKVLSTGKMTLLEKFKIDFQKTAGNPLNPKVTSSEQAKVESDLYFTRDFKTVERVKLTKNAIVDIFGEDKTRMLEFMKVNKLKVNNNNHLALLFNYYNGG